MENAAGTALASDALNRHVLTDAGPSLRGTKGSDQHKDLASLSNPEEVIKVVLSRARYAADYRRSFEDEWHRGFLAMFQVFATELESSWGSQRYMPMILSNVETAHSVIGSLVVDAGKICRFQGKTPEGRDCARAHEELLDAQNKGPVKVGRKIFDSEWWALVTGTAIVDTGWTNEKGYYNVPVVEKDERGENVKVMRVKEVVVSDHPFITELNPLDVYLCPHSKKGTDHEWVVMRVRCTMGEVRAAAGKGHIDAGLLKKWEEETSPTDGKPQNSGGFDAYLGPKLLDIWLNEIGKSDVTDQAGDDEDAATDDKLVELLIYRSKGETVTLGSDRHMLGYSRNKFAHRKVGIATNPFIEIKGCPYGRGLAGLLLGHNELMNANVNLFADVLYVSMMRPMVVDRSLISILDDEAIFEPNTMLKAKMNARDAIVPLDIPAPSNLFLLWDNHLKRDADDTGGFTEQARGQAPTNSPTATEFSGIQANVQNRLKKHVLNLKWFVEDICSLLKQLNEQFMDQEAVVSVVGEDGLSWRTIKPWELVGEVICQATTSPKYANPDLHVQRQIQLFQVVAPIIMSGKLTPPITRLLRSILRAANTDDVDLILPAGSETAKSWRAENQYALRGGKLQVSMSEIQSGISSQHVDGHSMFLQELKQDPSIPPDVLAELERHITEHMTKEEQFGQVAAQMATGGSPSGMQQEGNADRQEATALGQAQGGGGIPGAASPGPMAPPGRAM